MHRKLLKQLASTNNSEALNALDQLRRSDLIGPDKKTLSKIDLSNANLYNAHMSGLMMWRARFEGAVLVSVNMVNSIVDEAVFDYADLRHSVMTGAFLNYASFRCANLDGSDFRKSMCSGAVFIGASLNQVDFQNANLSGASFVKCDLVNTNLKSVSLASANLTNSIISDTQLASAFMLVGATMPDGQRYNGRFRLDGDLDMSTSIGVDINDDEQMSKRYGVPLPVYRSGQKWADDHL